MLASLVPGQDADLAYEWLAQLPFVEPRSDGLSLHDAVQSAIAGSLRTGDPSRYRVLRLAAWRQLRSELRTAPRSDLWRLTADLLFLIENPILREGFFPSSNVSTVVEPSHPSDFPDIRASVDRHACREAAQSIEQLWHQLPEILSPFARRIRL